MTFPEVRSGGGRKTNIQGKIRTKVDLVSTKYWDRKGGKITADEYLKGKGWEIIP